MLLFPPVLIALALNALAAPTASGVSIYRIGTPFSKAEKDSLDAAGIDFREIEWSVSQRLGGFELDSLAAGSLQPDFFEEDEDIASTLLTRDGWAGVTTWTNSCFCFWDKQIGAVLVDEDPTTSYTWPAISPESFGTGIDQWPLGVVLDLGGRFLIREVRFRPLEERPDHFLEHIILGVADRGFDLYRIPKFPKIAEVKENTEPEVRVRLDPPETTEAIQLRFFRTTPKELGLAAVEVYGGGYVSQSSYESDVIELEDIASWGEIRWSGKRDPAAGIDIRTRAGADPQPEIFWEARREQQEVVKYLQGGGDLSYTEYKRQYEKLTDFFKPPEQERITLDTENWSFWSSPYAFENPATPIISPSPRQFIQLRADFTSTIDEGGKLDFIEFKASVPPAVRRLVGEIFPVETEVGDATHFTYYIKPTILSGDSSFDGVAISTPSGVVSVDSVRVNEIDWDFSRRIYDDGLGFEVVLPRKLEATDSGALLEVVFNAPVLREVGTLFEGEVFDTSKPNEVRQRVVQGNAVDRIESDRLAVRTSLSSSLVFAPRASPNPFTPNGDGVNDVVNISYKLLRVTTAVPVAIEIFELSGRRVKRLYAGDDPLGEYSHGWDGTASSSERVPPGLYLYRITADLESRGETRSGLLSVAY